MKKLTLQTERRTQLLDITEQVGRAAEGQVGGAVSRKVG
jgi:hypothetical protein